MDCREEEVEGNAPVGQDCEVGEGQLGCIGSPIVRLCCCPYDGEDEDHEGVE